MCPPWYLEEDGEHLERQVPQKVAVRLKGVGTHGLGPLFTPHTKFEVRI